ncbi:MAG: hypothetical protein ACRDF0_09055 [Candidatus Limnocylindria bacterium]
MPAAAWPAFDPVRGRTVIPAPAAGTGHWAGAPSALHDGGRFYLAYRLRAPRPRRGYELRIAAGEDGERFTDRWSLRKEELGSASLERACLVRADEGYRLYVSYVDAADARWRVDVLEADRPDGFDARERRAAVTAALAGAEGVKDPKVLAAGGSWLMLASVATAAAASEPAPAIHASEDAFAVGAVRSATGLAASDDGLSWRWEGIVLAPPPYGWDAYETRLTTVLRRDGGYLGIYDGIARVEDNYEERAGLATSTDLRSWRRLTLDGPALRSPHGTGSLRYVDAVEAGDATFCYYECARPDGAHDLRLSVVSATGS